MKKKLLAALLFLCIFSSGCSVTDLFHINNTQTNQQTTDKKISTDNETEPKKTDSNSTPEETRINGENTNVETEEQHSNTPSTTRTPNNEDSKQNSNDRSVESPVANGESSAVPAESENKVESNLDGFFENLLSDNNSMMLGIIAALILLTLTLIWLIYDRRKMQNTLNNLNSRPPSPNSTPQNLNNSSQSSMIIETQILNPVNEKIKIRVDNLQQIGNRKEQQDSFCVSDIGNETDISVKGLMAVVADGMGGMEGGAAISNLVTETFLNCYNNQVSFDPIDFLYRTAESSEFAVENYTKQNGISGGSTLVAVIIKNSQMHYVSVGDSHIYLLRDNTLTLLNKEHSLGALLKEKAARGEVDPMEPYTNPKRNSLTAYIGMGSFQIVDRNTNPIVLNGGDKILLCSDGVYNTLSDDLLVNALAGTASAAAKRIQADILAQNIPSQDNFTAIVIECIEV